MGALAACPGSDARVCVTAQHRATLDQVLALFGIVPQHELDLRTSTFAIYGLAVKPDIDDLRESRTRKLPCGWPQAIPARS